MMNSDSASMYASSPIMIRKALEYDRLLSNFLFPGSLEMASARRVLDNVDMMKMIAMLAITGMMPATWNRWGNATIAGPQQLLVINAIDPMLPMDLIDVGSQVIM